MFDPDKYMHIYIHLYLYIYKHLNIFWYQDRDLGEPELEYWLLNTHIYLYIFLCIYVLL